MNTSPTSALPIWLANSAGADEYAEFLLDRDLPASGDLTLLVAADSEYNVYLDGSLVAFGQYQDYPGRVVFDTVRLSLAHGVHALRIIAWHWGRDSFTHTSRPPYILFELRAADERVLSASSAGTLSRPAPGYVTYKNHTITSQLGTMCEYSAVRADSAADTPFLPSALADVGTPDGCYELIPRPIKRCRILSDTRMTAITRGYYKESPRADGKAPSSDPGLMLDQAELGVSRGDADGCMLVADTGAEETGFIKFLLKTKKPCRVYIGWGEHLTPGRDTPRAAIHSRRFVYVYEARADENFRLEPMRRVGCRYLELFCSDPDAEIKYLGLAPVRLPVERAIVDIPAERRPLYDCAVRTLELCMHEHYEDCPWREQSLYTLDSRTQMRCGYRVFRGGNADFARASLDLISRSERADGLLSLCAPAGIDRPIPCYSLAYILQMKEYADFSGDAAFIKEKLPLLERIMSVFTVRRSSAHCGAVLRFPDRCGYWNFYEWAESLDGKPLGSDVPDAELPAEAPLTAFLALAASDMAQLCRIVGNARATEYERLASELTASIREVFFDAGAGFFRSFTDRSDAPLSVLTQSLCLLAGAGDGIDVSPILSAIASNGSGTMIPATLSSAPFRYDALVALGERGGGDFLPILSAGFLRDGEYMLSHGATTLWETIKGSADFGGAGSLCHGWSSFLVLG